MPAVLGEHMAYGDTGVVIYSNSVLGARSNFEGGPSALAAGLTGRTPRYGYHLPETATRHAAAAHRTHAARTARVGCAGWHRRPDRRRLLAGAGAGRHRPRSHVGRAQALRCGAGELWLGRAVPHGRRHAGGGARGRSIAGGDGDDHRGRSARIPGGLSRAHRHGGCGGVLLAAAQPAGAARPCRHAGWTTSDDPAAGGDQPTGQAGCRPLRHHRAHRGGGRPRAVGHVLLPELRARDGGGEWLADPRHHRRRSWSTFSAAMAIGRLCCRCRNASMRRAAGGSRDRIPRRRRNGSPCAWSCTGGEGWIFRTL